MGKPARHAIVPAAFAARFQCYRAYIEHATKRATDQRDDYIVGRCSGTSGMPANATILYGHFSTSRSVSLDVVSGRPIGITISANRTLSRVKQNRRQRLGGWARSCCPDAGRRELVKDVTHRFLVGRQAGGNQLCPLSVSLCYHLLYKSDSGSMPYG
jgi:hypothetical protein